MGLTAVVLVGAAILAALTGGRWSRLADLPLRHRRLVVAAVVAQTGGAAVGVLGFAAAKPSYAVGLAVSAACALGFCLANVKVAGLALVALGLAANAAVVAANGAMPVSIDAAARAGVPLEAIASGSDPRHEVAGDGTTWRVLGDVVPVSLPLRPEVASPGDVLVAAGLAELLVTGMRRRRRAHPG